MLTIPEIVLTVLSLAGIAYNVAVVARHFDRDGKWYIVKVWMYAIFVVVPHISVTLYALMHMNLD